MSLISSAITKVVRPAAETPYVERSYPNRAERRARQHVAKLERRRKRKKGGKH